jgi:hypothetical protein
MVESVVAAAPVATRVARRLGRVPRHASSDHDMLSRASSADDAAGPNVPAV